MACWLVECSDWLTSVLVSHWMFSANRFCKGSSLCTIMWNVSWTNDVYPLSITSSSSEQIPSWKWPACRLIGCSTHHPSAVVLCSMAPKNPAWFWYFLPPSLCQCWCHVAESSPGINFGNDVMCLHFQLAYQQEMKGGGVGPNVS